jgi:hypothetical protein
MCISYLTIIVIIIISGWCFLNPFEKYESQLGLLFPIYGKNKSRVPNHQPSIIVPSGYD